MMTEAQLDNMLSLCEMGISAAYGRPPLWCTCHADRYHRAAGQKISHWQVLYGFLGDDEVYSVDAGSLSELLGQIKKNAQPAEPVAPEITSSRKVLVDRKAVTA